MELREQEIMANNHIQKVEEILGREGWSYRRLGRDIIFIASYGSRKLKMNINCTDEGQVCCIAAYPWPLPEKRQSIVFAGLNDLNLRQIRGCFLVSANYEKVLYRCGVQILDEYTGYDSIQDILLTSVAVVNNFWTEIYTLLYGVEEGLHNRLAKEVNNG